MHPETEDSIQSSNFITLRLTGENLPPGNEVTALLGIEPEFTARKGEEFPIQTKQGLRMRRPISNIWSYNLADWKGDVLTEEVLRACIPLLSRLAPMLATLERPGIIRELYMSTTRYFATGGHIFPPELIQVAAEAHLAIGISIMVLLDDDDEETPT